ncbi:hypothetical protein ACOMHN_054028 [Nucella lapillus]
MEGLRVWWKDDNRKLGTKERRWGQLTEGGKTTPEQEKDRSTQRTSHGRTEGVVERQHQNKRRTDLHREQAMEGLRVWWKDDTRTREGQIYTENKPWKD